MERAEWLKKIRTQAEALYDHLAPAYWVKFGKYPDAPHRQFLEKFSGAWARRAPSSMQPAGPGSMMDAA